MNEFVIYQREIADILIPPVNILDDKQATNELLELHREQKLLFNDLVTGEASFEEILEGLEGYIGLSNMDEYVEYIEDELVALDNKSGGVLSQCL